MVRVDNNVEPHELVEGGVVHAEHVTEVGAVVQLVVVGGAQLAVLVRDPVDERAHLTDTR